METKVGDEGEGVGTSRSASSDEVEDVVRHVGGDGDLPHRLLAGDDLAPADDR